MVEIRYLERQSPSGAAAGGLSPRPLPPRWGSKRVEKHISYTEIILLRQHLLTPAERQQYLDTILKNTRSLKRLIFELFELSKLEASHTVPQPEPFSLTELVHDVVQQLAPVARARAVVLRVAPAPTVPFACADVGLLERVLQNLLDNALRHTPAGGQVCVDVAPANGRLALHVRDTGPGIAPPPDLPHIFNRFYRTDQVRRKSQGGLGLGLAIARRIVELHGGELTASSPPARARALPSQCRCTSRECVLPR